MLPLSNLPVLCVFGCPDSCCCVMTASMLSAMSRGDFAVLGFWFVSCIIFTCGCQPIPWLTCGREKKRDPLFYTGIVLISIGCLLVVCYFNRDTCRSHSRADDRPLPDVGPAEVVSRQESLPGEEAEAETSTVSPSMKILGVVGLAATAFGGAVASGAVF